MKGMVEPLHGDKYRTARDLEEVQDIIIDEHGKSASAPPVSQADGDPLANMPPAAIERHAQPLVASTRVITKPRQQKPLTEPLKLPGTNKGTNKGR